ncbi:unnamed protein product [Didymodactylos carnosus]|uniref:Kinesin-like protein n=1 Tax=Didymodactylos carnosus TaxID=1234261 RepID=A0A813XQ87_9BILA|nr:unnamed protein product [Didymodactylos carnosus]CAF3660660.1 unnamed protein product [Didymodactylos carnosus]
MPQRTSNKVKVYLRTRPTNNFASDIISFGRDNRTVTIHRAPSANTVVDNNVTDWSFHLDGLFHNVNQEEIFNAVAKDVIDRSLDGYNGTIMCYGQTGAGKTHTMTGFSESYPNRGIIPRALQHIYQEINSRQDYSYSIRIAYLEIYNDQMCDLLRTVDTPNDLIQQQLSIGEDRGLVYVKGLSYRIANSEEEALNLLFEGETSRSIGQHILNKQSSRSHCIFTLLIECRSILASDEKYTVSKLNLVDLAGSERLAKTNSQGIAQREATFINKSLSFLEQAVLNLSDKKTNTVHFRSSKLTHALKDSIGGRCNTVMIANVWPETQHLEETVSTLRFASRMMCVPAEPAVNEVVDPIKAVENYKKENKYLREELALHDTLHGNRSGISYEPLSEQQLYEIENQCRRFIDGSLDELEIKNVRQVQAVFNTLKNICKSTDGEVEKKYRERYVLMDKNEYDQTDGQKARYTVAGTNQNDNSTGELDGQGFGSGNAPKDARTSKDQLLKMTKNKRGVKASVQRYVSKLGSVNVKPTLKRNTTEEEQMSRLKDSRESTDVYYGPPETGAKEQTQPSTPPTRNVAFEEFRQTRGSNLNAIYQENKDIMLAKKKQFAELARRINQTKGDIDKTRMDAERKKNERLNLGEFTNENGETIIDEEEYELISKLQELKANYRVDFDNWKTLKSEIAYCQNLVNQCQQRLIQEFDSWFNDSYLSTNKDTRSANGLGKTNQFQVYEDAAERFERMQKELLMSDLDMFFLVTQVRLERLKIKTRSSAFDTKKRLETHAMQDLWYEDGINETQPDAFM